MDSSPDREEQKPFGIQKSNSFSPKVTRPRLPTFSSFRSPGGRAKTDPGRGGEIKTIMEDIMNLNKVDFVKMYSRPRVLRTQAPSTQTSQTTSTPTSPVIGSPTSDTPRSGFSRNRSRSLKLLTDKLKSGRISNDSSNIPSSSDLSRAAAYGTLRKRTAITAEEPTVSTARVGPQESSKDSEAIDEEASAAEMVPQSKPSRPETSQAKLETSGTMDSLKSPDKSSEDEGLCVSEPETSPTTSTYTYQPLARDSAFLKLAAKAPQRRSGRTTLATLGKVQATFGSGYSGRLAGFQPSDDDNRQDEQGAKKSSGRGDSNTGTGTQRAGVGRFTTHPPHRKTMFREEGGVVDSNGFGSMKTEEADNLSSQSEDSTAAGGQALLAESQMSESDVSEGPSKQEETEKVGNEAERFEKRNGKSIKQKSKSDPSANKSKAAAAAIAKEIYSSHAHSSPLLSRDVPESGPLLGLQSTEKEMQQGSQSETLLTQQSSPRPPSAERRISREHQRCQSPSLESTIEEDAEMDISSQPQDLLKPDRQVYIGSSAPTTPQSQSPTGTLERTTHHLLSVPSPRKPILRSISSASVFQRDRRLQSAGDAVKDKEPVRKYSINSEESIPGSIKSGTLVPEFAAPLGEAYGFQASSMPDVWNQNRTVSDSPEREVYIKISGFGGSDEARSTAVVSQTFNQLEQCVDKRYHIVEELFRNEQEYVEALRTLKDRYMIPLKTQSSLDDTIVDNIFYMIPEIFTHHSIYLKFLDSVWENWDSKNSTVGNIIYNIFSKQTVLDSYLSFVENYKTSGKDLENAVHTKSSVHKFIEQCQKDSGSKLSMKDLIVRPIQRIPRYELLIQRLLENTPKDHPDFPLLHNAEKVMHDLAMKIGTVNDSQQEEGHQETLKKLELLLIADLAVPDRMYLRHDMVTILSKKDQCCIWMFTDLLIISSAKRKSGPVTRKVSIILKSPTGQDFAENIKHKTWLRVGLDDIEIIKAPGSLTRKPTIDREQTEDDLNLINQISDMASKLSCSRQSLDEVLKEMSLNLHKQLTDCHSRSPSLNYNKLELQITTQEKVLNLMVIFMSVEKRVSWECSFFEAKQKLSLLSDKRAPEFLQPLQITKTRAGMQFSCAAPIDGVNATGYREVWVCNSDGYVGHMCLLSLQPEPIVTLNTPVPGCNARILCICAVPAYTGGRRRSSVKNRRQGTSAVGSSDRPRINVETVDSCIESIAEDGYQSDSDSSDDERMSFTDPVDDNELHVEDDDAAGSPPSSTHGSHEQITSGHWTHDAHKSTMWLGTEDGCIHIFLCTDNIKTTKNKLKIQHGAAVYCIIYLDNKVFVSLANGDILVYRRDLDGQWDTDRPYTRTLGTATAPITKMHAVAGKLWCGSQNVISVVNPLSLNIESTFSVGADVTRNVQCLVSTGQGVWIACQHSSKVCLYHATTYEFLMDVNITPAVSQKLQSADDIIRQHKTACLRITALLICKDLLWIGTSAGVILTIPIPKITSTTIRGNLNLPSVTGLVYGHTGHVRFLTCVELPNNTQKAESSTFQDSQSENLSLQEIQRRSSMATTATMATRMLVISGGDGYEDFRNNASNEAAGRDDSTNHLLLWQV